MWNLKRTAAASTGQALALAATTVFAMSTDVMAQELPSPPTVAAAGACPVALAPGQPCPVALQPAPTAPAQPAVGTPRPAMPPRSVAPGQSYDGEQPQLGYPIDRRGYLGEPTPVVTRYKLTPRWGMIIGGAVTFGALYTVSATTMTVLTGELKMAIPIAGPFLLVDRYTTSSDVVPRFWMVTLGLAEAAGLGLTIAGAVMRTKVPVFERMILLPMAAPGTAGLTASGRF